MTSQKFDKIFEKEGHGLPVPFLRALAKRESNLNPKDSKGPAWGLLQVGINANAGNVLSSYNHRHGTSLTKSDMLDPAKNVRVASDLLSRIVSLYNQEGIKTDWGNGNFIGLVVAGWNSGYSRKAGTIKVIRHLAKAGLPVTHENVFSHSKAAGATKHLGNPKKLAWQKGVVALALKEFGKGADTNDKGDSTTWLPVLLLLLLLR